ncbi:hypothetical protein HAP47_0021760 [Bradyrhizobium sp. 41S5]|uniref:hypothetical protein n=1 Tax=Bradyrhizobium sp. 41S5 TaxID=1404443 RepID=UPI00156B51A4|nr:hypothetical protein [Bradyrhizobium sp. 41S5]UFX41926.1 hypothetical protein HAP47_0021760 [Bradyrhizobium sp. 41S5]
MHTAGKVKGEKPDWFPDWSGETAVIVASGPSATHVDLAQAKGKAKLITINDSWRLAPWADALYAHDEAWWDVWSGVPSFNGLKISGQRTNPKWDVKLARINKYRDEILVEPDGTIGWGSHGGFHALNLAIQFGARRIVLVGYDCRIDQGINWHGGHQHGLPNKGIVCVTIWRKVLDMQALLLKKLGVEVLNASPVSTLTAYQKVEFAAAVQGAEVRNVLA